eukprot:jgi/Ulvmu1/6268/UM028_0126.1
MALRKLASEATSRLGVSFTSSMQQPSLTLGGAWTRAYAKVMEGYKYAESHEWVSTDGDVATVGISDFAQGELGDVVYVELPEVGKDLEKQNTFGVVESVKTASDVYAPVSGKVVMVNSDLEDEPGKVNQGPHDSGWLIKIKMSNPSEVDGLLDSDAYSKKIE